MTFSRVSYVLWLVRRMRLWAGEVLVRMETYKWRRAVLRGLCLMRLEVLLRYELLRMADGKIEEFEAWLVASCDSVRMRCDL